MRGFYVTVAALAVLSGSAHAQRRVLHVHADVSLREAAEFIEKKFEAAQPNVDVRLTFAGSGRLADGIKSGATADVFASAGPRPIGSIATLLTRPRIFAKNSLVLVTPVDQEAITRLPDLAQTEKILLPVLDDPAHAYARQMLDRAAQAYGRGWLSLVDRHLVAESPDVRAVLAGVAAGEADAGIVYTTDAKAMSRVRTVPLAGGLNIVASYSAAAVRRSANRALAESFVEYLLAAGSQAELTRRGFVSPLVPVAELPVSFGNESLRLFADKLSALPQASAKVGGTRYRGADLKAILSPARGRLVRITGADGLTVDITLAALRKGGALILRMPDGNLRVVLPSEPTTRWVRWVRRIEVL
ncbi:MAG: molybdate ABC transporter substrate-binding protein [Fimbriimonas sp.]